MRIIHVLKDGTVIDDISTIIVPNDIVESFNNIAKQKVERERNNNGNRNKTRNIYKK